jgi:flagellar assembly factor FliW
MPHINTRDFGPLEYADGSEIHFPHGLPGFEEQKRFILIDRETSRPLIFLQSVVSPELCFVSVPVSLVDPEYRIGITAEDLAILSLVEQPQSGDGILLLAILAPDDAGAVTANLLAPVVINTRTRAAVQAVRDDRLYSHRHPVRLMEGSRC